MRFWVDNFILLIVITCFATWRITNIINSEYIFEPVRKFLGEKDIELENGIVFTEYPTFLSKLVSCFMCLSVWVGLGCTLLLFICPYILLPFFFSAMGIVINRWIGQL